MNFILGFVQLSIGRGLLKGMIDKDESSNRNRKGIIWGCDLK